MPDAPFFVSGGTMPLSASSYVERAADRALFDALENGRYAYVLNARQMGKSSLCVRTVARLEAQGVRTAFVDLTRIGGRNVTPEQWYLGLLGEIGRGVGGRAEVVRFWKESPDVSPMQRFFGALAAFALPEGAPPLVVFVDEVDATRSLPFSADEFFGGVRECFNRRAHDPTFERLTFCLLGAAIPSDLIRDMEASPFNVGERIAIKDFSREEALAFAAGLGEGGRGIVERVFNWTGGHPFLTQSLCARLAEAGARLTTDVDRLVEADLFAPSARESNVNLADVGNRVLLSSDGSDSDRHRAEILALYDRVRKGKRVDDESNPRVAILKLSGLVVAEGGLLRVRNRIYARVFGPAWIAEHTPDGEARRVRRAYRVGLLRAATAGAALLAVVGALGASALGQAHRAENALAQVKTERDRARDAERRANASAQEATTARNLAEGLAVERTKALTVAKKEGAAALIARNAARDSALHAGRLAIQARDEASRANRESDNARRAALAATDQRRLADARLRTAILADANGRMERGDDAGALRPLVAGLRIDAKDPVRAAVQRRRIAFALAGGSGLRQVWSTKGAATVSAFSPDGRLAAVGDAGGGVHLWSVKTGAPVGAPMRLSGKVKSLAFRPDGRCLVAADGASVGFWDAATGRPLAAPRRAAANDVVFSSDGRLLAIAEGDGTDIGAVSIFDGHTFAPRGRQQIGSRAIPAHLAFSPDGDRLGVGCVNWIFGVVDLDRATGEPRAMHSAGTSFNTFAVRFVGGGRWIAMAGSFESDSRLGNASLCDATTGADLLYYRDGRAAARTATYQSTGTAIDLTPKGDAVLVANSSGVARLWGTIDSVPQGPPLRHDSPVVAAVLSPDGARAATACRDGSVRVWDPRTGEVVGSPFWHGGAVTGLAYDPSGTRLLSSSEDGTARVWEVGAADHGIRRAAFELPTIASRYLAPIPESRWLSLSINTDRRSIFAFDPATLRGQRIGGEGGERALPGSYSGMKTAVISKEGRIAVWDTVTNRPLTPLLRYETSGPGKAALSSGGRLLTYLATPDTVVARRVGARGGVVASLRLDCPIEGLVATDANGDVLLMLGDGGVALWRPSAKRVVARWRRPGERLVSFEFTPDGRRVHLLWQDAARSILPQVYDIGEETSSFGARMTLPMETDVRVVLSNRVAFVAYGSHAGAWIARLPLDGQPALPPVRISNLPVEVVLQRGVVIALDKIFDADTGALRCTLEDQRTPGNPNDQVRLSPDGSTFLSLTQKGEAALWNARTGRLRLPPLAGLASASATAFSPDGTLAAAGGANGDVRVWDAHTGEPVTPVLRNPTFVSSIAFAPDGRSLAIVADGVTVVPLKLDDRPLDDLSALAALVSAGGKSAHVGPAEWILLRRSYPREFAFRGANPTPAAPPAQEADAVLATARREVSLGLDGPDAWFDYALATARIGRWDEGLTAIERAEKKGRNEIASTYLKGAFQARLGRSADAVGTFKAARAAYPGPVFTGLLAAVSLQADDFAAYAETTQELLDERRDRPRAGDDQRRYSVALAYSLAGRGEVARRLLAPGAADMTPGIDLQGANSVAWMISVVPGTLVDYGPVLRGFEPLVRAKPDWASLNTLGLLLYRSGRHEDARRAIEQGLRLNGGKADPADRLVLGAALLGLKHPDEGLPHLQAAVNGFVEQLAPIPKDDPARLEIELLLREARGLLRTLVPDSSGSRS